jgi:KDO2-lipid IV(A) lauroyltransferase
VTPSQRAELAALRAATWLACHLPDRPLHRVFHALGAAAYLTRPTRRDLARRNLTRICAWLVAEGRATPRVARAARDARAMDRLVRDAFGHHARYYLEVLRRPTLSREYLEARIDFGDWRPIDAAFEALAAGRGLMYLGLHLGSMEVPAQYAILRTGRTMMTLMETVADPAMQAWVVEQRQPIGLEIVDPAASGNRLLAYARAGGLVGIVCDRPIVGAARPTELFGAPADLPVGPALVAIGTAVACQIAVARRTGYGTYQLSLLELAPPEAGQPMRSRVAAFLAAEARAIETLVEPAPEQWWTIMYPIWDDIR